MAESNGVGATSPAVDNGVGKASPSPAAQPGPVITNGTTNNTTYVHSTSNGATDSMQDSGASRRPRDARLVHLMLASLGVTSYQERVPLALMDIAYRYTNSILQDALLYNDTANPSSASNPNAANITLADLRMAIASRVNHQFVTAPPKEFMLDIAQERNKVALPTVKRDWGVRLPPEQYCLTGVNWELIVGDEEEDEDEDDEDEEGDEGDEEGEEEQDEMDVEEGGKKDDEMVAVEEKEVGEKESEVKPERDEDMEDAEGDFFGEAEETTTAPAADPALSAEAIPKTDAAAISADAEADADGDADEDMGGV